MKATPFIAFLLISMVFFPVSTTATVNGDVAVMDPNLIEIVRAMGPGDRNEVVVMFSAPGSMTGVEDTDVIVLDRIDELGAMLIEGDRNGILAVSGLDGVSWMEDNYPVEYFLERSTKTIGAQDVWNRVPIRDGAPDQELNELSRLLGIDGRGVTVAVVDTGVDAGHPDLDYGEKVVENWHSSAGEPWTQMENSDTSYGHGTHCAGIVAGNGDASGGQRKGVAPGATLIGVGGDWTPLAWQVVEGLWFVYDHSRPGNNPHNIRVVSNSWGGAGQEYNPESAVSQISEKLTYENNVVVVFAAGNDGGDGSTINTSGQSNTPAVIGVAASAKAGNAIEGFSSRGQSGNFDTYPDVAAPGQNIWATTPRGTWLDAYQRIDEDMYYMAINGTSMATPHVAGLAALMWQAAPSLKVSDYHEEFTTNGTNDLDDWNSMDTTRIHEVEYIMKMTADYILPTGDNLVPDQFDDGINDHPFDFAQGYGLVNATRSVAVCLVLEELRTADDNGDGRPDHPDASVDTALMVYGQILSSKEIWSATDVLTTSWRGEWANFINQSQNPGSVAGTYNTDQAHRVHMPDGSEHITITFHWTPINYNDLTWGTIDVWADLNGDGQNDLAPQPFDNDGTKVWESDVEGPGWAHFNVHGEAVKVFIDGPEDEFPEPRIEYTIHVDLLVSAGTVATAPVSSDTSPYDFGPTSPNYSGGYITIKTELYEVDDIEPQPDSDEDFTDDWLAFAVLALAIGGIAVALFLGFQMGRTLPKKD